ncbi:MAG TPA: adenylate/guanylate cyclase domain-containing protein [Pseudonocardiaceae bacterium]|nr:adenylate/guanylate cyclase domain-containing protein [Pseudonocardiaceae bacterium]
MTDLPDHPGVAREIEQTLLGGERRYNRIQVTRKAGVELDRVRRLWMAMGFAEVGDDEVVFTDGDIEALRLLDALVASGAISQADEVSIARALGQPLSRLADWQAQEVLRRMRDIGGAPEDLSQLAGALLPLIEGLQNYVWRRHLAAASGRALSVARDELATQTLAIGFADIVGYTTTTRHSDIDELAGLLEAFEDDAAETIAAHYGRVVKTVGDEVLFVADRAADAATIAVQLADPTRADRGLPTLRVGLAVGRVLSRYGDVYGSVVNVAARLTALARPGTALVDNEMADALGSDQRFVLKSLRPTSVRGYHHLRPWSLRRNPAFPTE